ncbi:50S ribosomal protein L34 [Naviculisporaceae sp. PSN 640]
MSGLRKFGASGLPLLRRAVAQKTVSVSVPSTARSFSILPSLRPTLQSARPVFRQPSTCTPSTSVFSPNSSASAVATTEGGVLDLVPKTAISSNPALCGIASQIRCGPRPTMSNASRLIQKRRHGFLSRIRTNKGRKVLAARKAKGRRRLCA